MKALFFLVVIALVACNGGDEARVTQEKTDTTTITDTGIAEKDPAPENEKRDTVIKTPKTPSPTPKVYSNQRFKEVTVEKIGDHKFQIKGKGQIFEANFSWVVEDGHEEIKKGYQQTDAGAPEWGNFDFTIDVEKKRPNSTLHLILFETSAQDGSRQYELPILLY